MGIALLAYAISDHPFFGGAPGFGSVQTVMATIGAVLLLCSVVSMKVVGPMVLVATTLFGMLWIAELALGLVLGSSLRSIYEADEKAIFRLAAGATGSVLLGPENGGLTVTHTVNSLGYRGKELSDGAGVRRVLVYGDSFIHAAYTEEQDTFCRQLEALLRSNISASIEAINAGVSSYGPDQIAARMEVELGSVKPDLVVVAIFAGNDFGDLLRNKMYRLGPAGELVANDWRLSEANETNFRLGRSESVLLKATRRAVASVRGGVSRNAADRELPGLEFMLEQAQLEYKDYVVDGNNVVTNTHVDYYSADVSLVPDSASARYKLGLMRGVMARIAGIARKEKVRLLFMFIPHPADLVKEWDWGAVDLARFPAYQPRNQVGALEAIGREIGVSYVSLFDVFASSDPRSLFLRGGDDHWNALGQRLAAEVVTRRIVQDGLLTVSKEQPNGK